LGTRLSRKLAVHRERRERGAPLVTQCTPEMSSPRTADCAGVNVQGVPGEWRLYAVPLH